MMAIGQVIGYVLIVGVLLPWVGSRRQVWPCVFVVVVSAFTTPLVGVGVATLLGFRVEDWAGPVAVVWAAVVYACLVVRAWVDCDEITAGGLCVRLAASARRSLVGVGRWRSALRDVRRAARGQQTLEYRIEVE